jgi:hypothetical protein
MDKQFDEFSKSLAQEGVSRREALRKFGVGMMGVLLASVGLSGSRSATGQGTVQCCHYNCSTASGYGQGKHGGDEYKVTICGPTCGFQYGCRLAGSKNVSDCTACI